YPTVSAELCVPKHLRYDLHCIGLVSMSAEPLSGADFALPSGTISERSFSLMTSGRPTSRLDQQPFPSLAKVSAGMITYLLQQQLNTILT
ncbi:hypothetical protein AVEN_98116-1, partial [Araneus ventricosus]